MTNLFSFIRTQVPILSVISQYTTLKPAGSYWKGACPFHQERTASFTVSPHKEIFYCFGCHAKGDAVSFMAQIERCTQFEAAKLLADRFNLQIDQYLNQTRDEIDESSEHKKRYFELMGAVQKWGQEQLQKSSAALAYLEQRGITHHSIQHFTIGYFPRLSASLKSLSATLQRQHFTLKELIDAHLLLENAHGLYSPFEERIIFPIHDHLGRCVAFGGRIYKKEDERPKYYNSKEHEFFTKGTILYGLDKAKKSIQDQKNVFVVEGYTDCIMMAQHGWANTVATLGTAMTPDHLKLLSRLADRVYVSFDGDDAGQKAALRLASLAWQAEMEIEVISLPGKTDPASFLINGGNLAESVDQAQGIFSFYVHTTARHFNRLSFREKLTTIKKLIETIATVPDPIQRAILIQQAAQELSLPVNIIADQIEALSKPEIKRKAEEIVESSHAAPLPAVEQQIIARLVHFPGEIVEISPELLVYFSETTKKMVELLKIVMQDDAKISLHDIMEKLDREYAARVYQAVISQEAEPSPMRVLILQALRHYWNAISTAISNEIALAQEAGKAQVVEGLLAKLQSLRLQLFDRGGTHG